LGYSLSKKFGPILGLHTKFFATTGTFATRYGWSDRVDQILDKKLLIANYFVMLRRQ